jgi:hypothetical protein
VGSCRVQPDNVVAGCCVQVQGLVLAVMYERALGSKSKWGPYLSFLPTDMTHMIMYWEVRTSQ